MHLMCSLQVIDLNGNTLVEDDDYCTTAHDHAQLGLTNCSAHLFENGTLRVGTGLAVQILQEVVQTCQARTDCGGVIHAAVVDPSRGHDRPTLCKKGSIRLMNGAEAGILPLMAIVQVMNSSAVCANCTTR